MFVYHDFDIKVAIRATVGPTFAFAGNTQLLSGLNAFRNLYINIDAFMFIAAAVAFTALISNYLTGTVAVRTDILRLKDPESSPLLGNNCSLSMTASADMNITFAARSGSHTL
ncbi:hypothetical protein SDC9_146107 [bioreactor metagenome]|uniref:Uncharacterized protein n=1 Tax=bioreactor metagenome TaxID=1076179 RepID=A0A645EAE4_9ZZZZ